MTRLFVLGAGVAGYAIARNRHRCQCEGRVRVANRDRDLWRDDAYRWCQQYLDAVSASETERV